MNVLMYYMPDKLSLNLNSKSFKNYVVKHTHFYFYLVSYCTISFLNHGYVSTWNHLTFPPFIMLTGGKSNILQLNIV